MHQDRKSAFEDVRPFLGGKYEAYADWGQDRALPGQESFRVSFEELARDRFIIGSPEDCIRDLERYRYPGIGHTSLRMIWPGMELEKAQGSIELFAETVMPYFTL